MAGIHEISAYQQNAENWNAAKTGASQTGSVYSSKISNTEKINTDQTAKTTAADPEYKAWKPIKSGSSLVPQKSDYGLVIGDVKLSDKAADYYRKLKAKFGNMEFIAVSSEMKNLVKQNAAMYGNASKQVVLIDEEKLEKMATDEDYRNKYEGIIAMSQSRLNDLKNSLASSGASVKNFGMSVDENGHESFFATIEKSTELQKERIEKKAEEKKEQKAAEKKKAEKELQEERIENAREKRKAEREEFSEGDEAADKLPGEDDDREYITFESHSLSELISKVSTFVYNSASAHVMTDAEKAVGSNIDFKG